MRPKRISNKRIEKEYLQEIIEQPEASTIMKHPHTIISDLKNMYALIYNSEEGVKWMSKPIQMLQINKTPWWQITKHQYAIVMNAENTYSLQPNELNYEEYEHNLNQLIDSVRNKKVLWYASKPEAIVEVNKLRYEIDNFLENELVIQTKDFTYMSYYEVFKTLMPKFDTFIQQYTTKKREDYKNGE